MSTANKLTYLNATKQKIKQGINSIGGNITDNTTFRNYATELDTMYDNLPKVTGTGTDVSLSSTLKGKLGFIPKGNALQNGTPTPSNPIDIQVVTGNNTVTVSNGDSQPQSYPLNLGSLELAIIGDYEDSIEGTPDNWVKKEYIGKADLSTLNYSKYLNLFTTRSIQNIKYVSTNTELGLGLAEKYKIHIGSGMSQASALNCFAIDTSAVGINTEEDKPSGLLYYAHETVVDVPITDTTLISQLNALYYANSYNGVTNISTTHETGNMPMVFTASALKDIPVLQAKQIEITENGNQNITADTGYDGLSNVNVTTNVSGEKFGFLNFGGVSFRSSTLSSNQLKNEIDNVANNLDTSTITTLYSCFAWCTNLSGAISFSGWNLSNCKDFAYMFQNTSLTEINFGNNNNIAPNNVSGMFINCKVMQKIDIRNFDLSQVQNLSTSSMFGSSASNGVPNNCLIIVADNTQKTLITSNFSRLTNVKTVSEYEN